MAGRRGEGKPQQPAPSELAHCNDCVGFCGSVRECARSGPEIISGFGPALIDQDGPFACEQAVEFLFSQAQGRQAQVGFEFLF